MRMLLALRDEKTGTFLAPVTAATPGDAERWYSEVLTQPGTLVSKHPRDFPLFEIGQFDEVQGLVIPLDGPPRLLVTAGQLGLVPVATAVPV